MPGLVTVVGGWLILLIAAYQLGSFHPTGGQAAPVERSERRER